MKRKIFTLAVFISVAILIKSQSLIFSTPIDIATGYNNLRPRISLTQNDVPVVIWGTSGTNPLYISRYNGSSFNLPIAVTPSGVDPYCANWTGPDIVSFGDDVWIVFDADINGYRVYTMKSLDGGDSFGDTVVVGDYSGYNRFSSIGIDDNGNPMVVFMDHDLGWTNPNYVVSNSSDGGMSWNNAVSASNSVTNNEVCDCCPAEIISSDNIQTVLFRNNNNNIRDVWASTSNNGGISFNGIDVDISSWYINACPSSAPHGLIRGDTLLSTWMSSGSGLTRVILGTSNILTGSVQNIEIDPNISNSVIQNYPRIAGDDSVFGIVYQEYSSGSYDVYMSYSFDGTSNIETTGVLVNDEVLGVQINPDIVYSNGIFHIVFQDDKTNTVKYLTATISGVDIPLRNKNNSISIYPNPSNGKVYVEIPDFLFEKSIEIKISDITGKFYESTLIENLFNNTIAVSLPQSKGVYMLSVFVDKNIQQTFKVVFE